MNRTLMPAPTATSATAIWPTSCQRARRSSASSTAPTTAAMRPPRKRPTSRAGRRRAAAADDRREEAAEEEADELRRAEADRDRRGLRIDDAPDGQPAADDEEA